MFGDIFSSVLDLADDIVSPMTETVEDMTGVSSDLQKDIITSVAVGYVTGGLFDLLSDD